MFAHVLYIVRPSWRTPMLGQVYGTVVAETDKTITVAYDIAGTTGERTLSLDDVYLRSDVRLEPSMVEAHAIAFGAAARAAAN